MNLKNLNTAESFALVRIVGFPLVLFFILLEERSISAWLYIILFSTDFIDGFFAFFFGQESSRRAQLDTLGDVLLLLVGMLGFYLFETTFFINRLMFITTILSLYFFQFLLALLKWKRPTSFHTFTAKIAAVTQVIFLSFTFFFEASEVFFFLAFVMSLIDVTEDIILTLILPRWRTNIKGLFWYRKGKRTSKEEEV